MDLTRRVAEVTVTGAVIPTSRQLTDLSTMAVVGLAGVLFAADAVGGSQWCVDTASEYAKDRRQFGRPIGQFQGVKHRCANMVGRTELARAATWDAARAVGDAETESFAAAAAASLAIDGYFLTAKDCVQTLGGIGFTWEHDAHVYLRRAMATRALLGSAVVVAGRHRAACPRWREAPADAWTFRRKPRRIARSCACCSPSSRSWSRGSSDVRVADEGFVQPQWPKPWGRGADALEQLVIDDELRHAGMTRPNIAVGGWALPPLMVYGTEEQQQRWIPPTLRGEIEWCQLFSEPGAGSDLASLTTRAERVEGGWLVSGQKVWTSMAERADWGILLARTDPEVAEARGHLVLHARHEDPRHRRATAARAHRLRDVQRGVPRRGVRPRRLPRRARARRLARDPHVARERAGVDGERRDHRVRHPRDPRHRALEGGASRTPRSLADVGELVARGYALAVLGFRLTLSALDRRGPVGVGGVGQEAARGGARPEGPGGRVGTAGGRGRDADGAAASWAQQFLFTRCLTIAGGTSEIQRNIIGERVLGLPKDP